MVKTVKKFENYCDVSLSTKDNREQQIKRVYCEEVQDGRYILLLVPKHSRPIIVDICKDHNIVSRMEDNQLKMQRIDWEELDNHSVRVIIPNYTNLQIFVEGLKNVKAISTDDDKKIMMLCNNVKKHQVSFEHEHESEDLTDDERRPFIPRWTSK